MSHLTYLIYAANFTRKENSRSFIGAFRFFRNNRQQSDYARVRLKHVEQKSRAYNGVTRACGCKMMRPDTKRSDLCLGRHKTRATKCRRVCPWRHGASFRLPLFPRVNLTLAK